MGTERRPERGTRAEHVDAAAERLHGLVMAFVREARLLQPDQAFPTIRGGVSLSQGFTLHELDTGGPLSQRELAERLHLEKSTVSRLVADLERRGLLARERDPANRRVYRLRLTDAGRDLRADIATAAHRTYLHWVDGLAPAELDAALTGLAALVRVVREDAPTGAHHAPADSHPTPPDG